MEQDTRLGPYLLLRRLGEGGEGGAGGVHLADLDGRRLAIRLLDPGDLDGVDARRRLSRDIDTVRRVRDGHIAEVIDADVTGPRPYIATRYVAGPTLEEVVRRDGPLSEKALLRVGRGMAEALAAGHLSGVRHGNLVPGNVVLADGEPVLVDFGIAPAVDAARPPGTRQGMFLGAPGYPPPELIEGDAAGPKSDVHSWASVLIFAATGRPPFGTSGLETIFTNILEARPDLDGVPPALLPVLRAALSRDPAERPTAADLAREMDLALQPGDQASPA